MWNYFWIRCKFSPLVHKLLYVQPFSAGSWSKGRSAVSTAPWNFMSAKLYHRYDLNLQQQSSLSKCLMALLCTSITWSNQSLEDKAGVGGTYEERFTGCAVTTHTEARGPQEAYGYWTVPFSAEIMTTPSGADNMLPAFYVDFFTEKMTVPFCRY